MSGNLFFVFNPASGKAQIKNNLFKIVNSFSADGWLTTLYPTQKSGDAYNITKELASSYDRIIVAGGDGTLNECVSALMDLDPKKRLDIGYIPTGTTNDFASTLGIPKNIPGAIKYISNGKAFPCDVGRFNDKSFLYVAAFGAFTDVAYNTPQQSKNFWGQSAYIAEGIKKLPALKPKYVKITCPDLSIEGDFIFGMVSNTNSIGGIKAGKVFKAELNDGLFEVILVKNPKNLAERQEIIAKLISKDLSSDLFCVFKTDHIIVESSEEVQWTLDGEFGGNCTRVDIKVDCQAVSFIIDK